ncbi:MAG TPA: sigma-70 family RNA polymerase sigma factor [Acidimicrobiales bacterium]
MPSGAWDDELRDASFAQMYSRCHPMLVSLCRRLLNGRGDPEAIAQEAFLKAWSALGTFSGARPFWPWVATIARRLCVDEMRRITRDSQRAHVKMQVCGASSTPDPIDLVIASEEEHAAVDALNALPPRERRLIGFRDLDGWSYEQIAHFEGITVEAVRGSLKRARAALRRAYETSSRGVAALLAVGPLRRLRDRMTRTAVPDTSIASAHAGYVGEALAATLIVLFGAGVAAPAPSSHVVAASAGSGTSIGSVIDAAAEAAGTPVASRDAGTGTPAGTPAQLATAPTGQPTAGPLDAPTDLLPGVPVATAGPQHPDQARIDSVVMSPAGDGTVFAAGRSTASCDQAFCPVLFRSDDWGKSWRRLPALGFAGGSLLLPPTFPTDNRLFLVGQLSFLVSDDDGASFEEIAPVGGGAAISPTFGGGDPRIFLGNLPRWAYDDRVKAVVPAGLAVPSSSLTATFAFSPRYAADNTVYVGGTTITGGSVGPMPSAVYACKGGICTESLLPDAKTTPGVATAADGSVWAWTGSKLFRSVDGVAPYQRVALPVRGAVRTIVSAPGRVYVSVVNGSDIENGGGVLSTHDGGHSWQRIGAGTALAAGAATLTVSGTRVVAAPATAAGLLCAADGTNFGPCS